MIKDCIGRNAFIVLLVVFATTLRMVTCSLEAERLYTFLMKDYNRLVRPVLSNRDIVDLRLSLKFTQLIGVDEVNQVISTSVELKQTWNDYKLKWDPELYGDITSIDIPSTSIWVPDLLLFNNAEGDYEIKHMTNAIVNYTGDVVWQPPAIYKSYCLINVTYFPYDKQECMMKFGCWTYDATLVDLKPARGFEEDSKVIKVGMDLSEYKPSIEWDILQATAVRNKEVFSYGTFVDITFNLVIRRRALFYTVNLLIPCVLISFLTVFVFYLPSDSGEKVTFCISILLSLTVFVLLLAEVPLIGRYLLFTLVMVTCSIAFTILVINVHFRNPATHTMGPWVKLIFTKILPKILLIERPMLPDSNSVDPAMIAFGGKHKKEASRQVVKPVYSLADDEAFGNLLSGETVPLNTEVQDAIDGVNFIVENMRKTTQFGKTVRDWKYVAMVLDRLFLWIFAISCIVGTGKIILDAPALYETAKAIPEPCKNAADEGVDAWLCLPEEEVA